jgi:peptidoglycan/LPS O-acetylase OafA/YrhL
MTAHRPSPGLARIRHERIPILDGWRAVSILAVLGAHLLPIGPKWLQLNEEAGAFGMALFFTLSGFLIVGFLDAGMPVKTFLLKRCARVVPLSWLAMIFLISIERYDFATIGRNLLFTSNLPPVVLLHGGEHLWSLCLEMQFYVAVAVIFLISRQLGKWLIPLLCFSVTIARVLSETPISIITWFRADEILAGGIVALAYRGRFGLRAKTALSRLPTSPMLIAYLVISHPEAGLLQYLRPYAASFLVGSTLAGAPRWLERVLVNRVMTYIAEISYALYIIHGVLSHTWLGGGDKLEKYLKRPLLFGATFVLAHISTRYFEQPITRSVRQRSPGSAMVTH